MFGAKICRYPKNGSVPKRDVTGVAGARTVRIRGVFYGTNSGPYEAENYTIDRKKYRGCHPQTFEGGECVFRFECVARDGGPVISVHSAWQRRPRFGSTRRQDRTMILPVGRKLASRTTLTTMTRCTELISGWHNDAKTWPKSSCWNEVLSHTRPTFGSRSNVSSDLATIGANIVYTKFYASSIDKIVSSVTIISISEEIARVLHASFDFNGFTVQKIKFETSKAIINSLLARACVFIILLSNPSFNCYTD